jgi:group I intron endonuclease
MYCVYKIVNLINGKSYVGRSKHFDRRKIEHLMMLNKGVHHSKRLQNSYNKHGKDCFEFSTIFESEFESACIAFEQVEIDSGKHWYNISKNSSGGGVKAPNKKNRTLSLEKLVQALVFFINNDGDLLLTSKTFGISKSYLWNLIKGNVRKYEDFGDLRREACNKVGKIGPKSKPRGKYNCKSFRRKLDNDSIINLFKEYSNSSMSCKEVGKIFGITETAVRDIIKRKTYSEVEVPQCLVDACTIKIRSRSLSNQTKTVDSACII